MPNLSNLSSITTAATALSNLILVSPQSTVGYQPLNPSQANGADSEAQLPDTFVFNYEGEQTVALQSDITDHYVEENFAVQDQIALKPEMVTTHGFIGELNDVVPFGLQTLKAIADKLTVVGAYAPSLSVTAELAYAEAFFVYQIGANVRDTAIAAWNTVSNFVSPSGPTGFGAQNVVSNGVLTEGLSQTKQQKAFAQFYGWWVHRILFRVQTPWAVFDNMAIQSLRAIQDAETRMITDFEITFKTIRTASTSGRLSNIPQGLQGRAQDQSSGAVDLGTSSPTPGPSLSSELA